MQLSNCDNIDLNIDYHHIDYDYIDYHHIDNDDINYVYVDNDHIDNDYIDDYYHNHHKNINNQDNNHI